jgi:hypothetical protein
MQYPSDLSVGDSVTTSTKVGNMGATGNVTRNTFAFRVIGCTILGYN